MPPVSSCVATFGFFLFYKSLPYPVVLRINSENGCEIAMQIKH